MTISQMQRAPWKTTEPVSRRSLTAAGKPYENEYCFVLRYVDGRIVEGWEFVDTAHAYDQFA